MTAVFSGYLKYSQSKPCGFVVGWSVALPTLQCFRPLRWASKCRYRKSPKITEFGKVFVVHLIEQDWSPEQVSERLRAMGWEDVPSHEWIYSQTTSKLKCVGSPCRIIYTVFGKPPVSLLKLFDYTFTFTNSNSKALI